jgi:streptomycin 6-kinase
MQPIEGDDVTFRVPRNLALASDAEREEFRDWVSTLPGIVRWLAERWRLQIGMPFEPGGRCAWVAPATDRAGRDLVLKVGWRHIEATHEAAGLRLWKGEGAVLLYDEYVNESTSALLLERCVPGTWLKTVLPERAQDAVVADLLRRLWREPPPGHPFRPLQVMCDQWADEFEQKLIRSRWRPDTGLTRAAIQMFRTLPTSAERCAVLATDLHGENILAAQREPWLVVDPKPYVGDPAYDVSQHMLNCMRRLQTDPVGLARRMAGLLGLDEERVIRWLFARCVLESLGLPSLLRVAARIAPD